MNETEQLNKLRAFAQELFEGWPVAICKQWENENEENLFNLCSKHP